MGTTAPTMHECTTLEHECIVAPGVQSQVKARVQHQQARVRYGPGHRGHRGHRPARVQGGHLRPGHNHARVQHGKHECKVAMDTTATTVHECHTSSASAQWPREPIARSKHECNINKHECVMAPVIAATDQHECKAIDAPATTMHECNTASTRCGHGHHGPNHARVHHP